MRTRNACKRFSVRAVSPESVVPVPPEKIRRVSQRQKGKGDKTRSNNSYSFHASCPESDKSSQELRRISPRQKCKENTKSSKNVRSSSSAVSPETEESPGMEKCESPRQKRRGQTKSMKNDTISSSDNGYGGSLCDDVTDCQRRERTNAAICGVPSAKKRKSEDVSEESSDSSSDDFLVPTQSLDLNSDFFKIEKKVVDSDFLFVENGIFAGINRLSESDDSDDLQDLKPVDIDRVISKQGIQTVKDEHCSAGPVAQKEEDVSVFTPRSTRRGKKTSNAKQQKASDMDSKQDNTLVSSLIKAEKTETMQKDKNQDTSRRRLHKVKEEHTTPDLSKLDVAELLALGEGQDPKAEPRSYRKTSRRNVSKEMDSEEDGDSEWEEVDTGTFEKQQIEHSIPKEGIAVTIKVPNMHQKKKKKKRFDVAAYIKRRMNRVRRDIQVLMHKAHLLCWIAHGNYVNKILNYDILMGLSLSLIPPKLCHPDKHIDLAYLQQIVQWFSKAVKLQENEDDEQQLLVPLLTQFQNKAAKSKRCMALMFVCMLRSLGINTRLVLSLQPLPLKPPATDISNFTSKKSASKGKKAREGQLKQKRSGRKKTIPNTLDNVKRKMQDIVTKEGVRSVGGASAKKVNEARKSNQRKSNEKPIVTTKSESVSDSGRSLRARKFVKRYIDDGDTTDSGEEVVCCEQESANISKIVNTKSATSKKKISHNTKNTVKNTKIDKVSTIAYSSVSESDYTAEFKVKKNRKRKPGLTIASSDKAPMADTKKTNKKKDVCDVWAEVFLEYEEKWICVDVYHQQIDCVHELYSRASQPVHYVLAWQGDGTIRDVTRRYCPKWHNVTRKLRVDEEWWRESLKPFTGQRTTRDDREEQDLAQQLQERPLPTSLAEYKNHPLYVLKKDLLKFQAIYPPDAPTLGFFRGHPVYARECVHTLQSREKWLKQAKIVRLGETPYRTVTTLKWDRVNRKILKDVPLEIFGPWQVEDYIPPTAVDGKVPRNEYGNVELFKPSMLPGGTVHMQIPGLNSIARKLQIDCAPAITGFDFHSGSCHPVYDGFVVCEEYKYVLAEAWQKEEEEADRRQEKKRLKRIYGNWRRLIKGVFIRERLKARYDFGPAKEPAKPKTKKAKRFQVSKRKKTDDADCEMEQCF